MAEMIEMRALIDLCEAAALEEAAGPRVLYHGTNLISACCIARDKMLRADDPVDDDDLGAVVCTSSSHKVARMFAVEFERYNSRLLVGAIFVIDPRKIQHDIVPYKADSAGCDEKEFRVQGNIPMDCVVAVKLVGKTSKLKSERFLERVWEDEARNEFWTYMSFYNAVERLISLTKRA